MAKKKRKSVARGPVSRLKPSVEREHQAKHGAELVRLGIIAVVAILIIFAVVFLLRPARTGGYVSTGAYNQYEPREVCEVAGCIFDLEVQRSVVVNPHNAPVAGCVCNGRIKYIPLIQRAY